MSPVGSFASASGLRPMSAFVVIAAVLGTVAGWIPWLSAQRGASQPSRLVSEEGEPPAFEIVDARGRVLAQSVPRFDLVMSPRSMWQAHTPDYMAERISELLEGEPAPDELLRAMLPGGREGWIEVTSWDLDARRANRLLDWIEGGEDGQPLPGIRVLPTASAADREAGRTDGARFRLFWNPSILLAGDLRRAHGASSALTWGRRLADGITEALRAPGELGPRTAEEFAEAREVVWAALFPKNHSRPIRGIPQEHALALRALLVEEGVSSWQMELDYASERVHPCGDHELFGAWGYPDAEATRPEPRSGLELAAADLIDGGGFDLSRTPERYLWLRDRNIRGQRENGFLEYREACAVPRVRTGFDLALQRRVGEVLAEVQAQHRPAVAMAIALDVESADVLALETADGYEIAPFSPIYHTFTPGSTFKLITMAVALEEGVVEPSTVFDVGPIDHYELVCEEPYKNGKGSRTLRRIIHEAEGSLAGRITAAESLAWSVNAGLVQIGLRVPSEVFHAYLVRLGYGAAPGSRLGIEKRGLLTRLPWSRTYTHASVSFGHELTTTLWQHASALATVVRGGVLRPLRLFASVEQGDRVFPLELAEGSRVFSERTCAEVRAMMRTGAAEGTGSTVLERMLGDERWRAAAQALIDEGVELGTKTGTAEKAPSELCVHVELAARERWEKSDTPVTRERYRSLRQVEKPHRSCYTSSMCVVGRSPESGREVMVLVVVDEPRGQQKFGSQVAGPAAYAILAEALGLTRAGQRGTAPVAGGFVATWEPRGSAGGAR